MRKENEEVHVTAQQCPSMCPRDAGSDIACSVPLRQDSANQPVPQKELNVFMIHCASLNQFAVCVFHCCHVDVIVFTYTWCSAWTDLRNIWMSDSQ